ncbi:MAG TPA: thymidylate synthase [Candidatus Absconditabacterales bacterium]|nr:thymidylate synthase [Candidatus Absconditabacterales bacterium]
MKSYLDIVDKILKEGVSKEDRTGTGVFSIPGMFFEHNMEDGFPLLTTKRVPFRLVASELEFFIKGITDKNRLIERNNHIRDERCSPDKVPYGHDEETKKKMMEERELGPIYGFQWRNFGAEYTSRDKKPSKEGVDQLKKAVELLKKDPSSRRIIVSARNPQFLHRMALPPCHYGFQILVSDGKLHLLRNQRSVDSMLGLPFNIASYALLLHLLAKEAGLKEGKLVGFLADTHIYSNHIEGAKEQLSRIPTTLPTIKTEKFTSIFDREYTDTVVEGYEPQARIKFDIAV